MRKQMAAANWKMNGDRDLVRDFGASNWRYDDVEVVFALPATLLAVAQDAGLSILAGQDASAHKNGAHTGELSAIMLKESGCEYVIIGHSERRSDHSEDEALLIDKWLQSRAAGLGVIYCIGESDIAHAVGDSVEMLEAQLKPMLEADLIDEHSVIAYEPVWAIGTGNAATPEYAQEIHQKIRQIISEKDVKISQSVRILYGGSVKPDNAAALITADDIDGFLVGGASLEAQSFTRIIEAML